MVSTYPNDEQDQEIDVLNEQLEKDARCLKHLQLQLPQEKSKQLFRLEFAIHYSEVAWFLGCWACKGQSQNVKLMSFGYGLSEVVGCVSAREAEKDGCWLGSRNSGNTSLQVDMVGGS
ncbi:hypothetical protein CRG98_013623 [Punica granatum]|uniref:Uncharacterized protein n=1 Tax=Punica granatum TaxID=22663 RepID=A0A2I0KBQ8_PUNGR|nr:hypothetical protein CRG98_013623 [Punica granatum]